MPFPKAMTTFNRDVLNPAMIHLAGLGPFAELEHVGRRSGRTYRIPIMAFRSQGTDGSDRVTIALTYGPEVDWLRNVEAAGSARLRIRGHMLDLGSPRRLDGEAFRARMPGYVRLVLPVIGCRDAVELTVLTDTVEHTG